MKRVLIFSLAYLPYVGGAEVAIKEIAARIPREDIAFDLITLRFDRRDPRVEQVGNVRVYRIALGGSYLAKALFPLAAAIGAWRLHKKNHYDAFWAMMSYMLFPIVLLRLVGIKLPYLLTLQEGDTYGHMFARVRIMPFLPLLHYGFRHATVVQAISSFLATWATARGFTGPLVVVPNGVDVQHFSQSHAPDEIGRIKDSLGEKPGDSILITTSRLVHKNAIDDVIRALPLLPPQVRFVVLGTGPDAAMLHRLADELGVAERIRFVGQVDHGELPKYLAASDVFVRPSRSEGMGNSFVEAMAVGLPTVGTAVGGIVDFLKEGETGFIAKPNNPQSLSQAILRALNDRDTGGVVAARGQVLVRAQYEWDQVARAMQDHCFSLL